MILRTALAGTPNTKEFAGMSWVTTAPAPITQPSPMVTPPQTVTLLANQQLLPMVIGAPNSKIVNYPFVCLRALRCCQRSG